MQSHHEVVRLHTYQIEVSNIIENSSRVEIYNSIGSDKRQRSKQDNTLNEAIGIYSTIENLDLPPLEDNTTGSVMLQNVGDSSRKEPNIPPPTNYPEIELLETHKYGILEPPAASKMSCDELISSPVEVV